MTKDEALKLAIGKIKSARDCHFAAIDPLLFEAEEILEQALAAPTVQGPVAQAWAEGYRAGIDDERTSEANIGIAGMGMKVEPARNNPYHTTPPAQPAVQEPFGYLEIDDIESQREYPNNCRNVNLWHEGGEEMVAIYTTPPAAQRQWVGLTDEEFEDIELGCLSTVSGKIMAMQKVEAKLKEKNT